MATAQRKSTAQSRTRKAGAAPAVDEKNTLTVESDPVVVSQEIAVEDRPSLMELAETEADAADAEAVTVQAPATPAVEEDPAQESPVAVPAEDAADPAVAVPVEHPDEDPVAPRDLTALRALADTSGQGVTPYPADGIPAPAPKVVLPPARDRFSWVRDGDTPATARVMVDGFRVQVNGGHRFARKGDIITAPSDIITRGVARGVLHLEA